MHALRRKENAEDQQVDHDTLQHMRPLTNPGNTSFFEAKGSILWTNTSK